MGSISQPSHTANYRPDIDGMRAVAVGLVIAFHVFPGSLTGGFIGVDVFFVISGYLITGLVVRGVHDASFSLAGFYRRRIRRLAPALAVVLAFSIALGYVLLRPASYEALGKHVIAGSLFVPNLAYLAEAGYFDADALSKPLLHLWSLGIEEQFYLLWPITVLALSRLGQRARFALAFALASASFAVNLALVTEHPDAAFFGPHARIWELLVGSLLAVYLADSGRDASTNASTDASTDASTGTSKHANATRHGISVVGALALALAAATLDESSPFPGTAALLPTIGTALLLWAGPTAIVNRMLAGKYLVSLGLISYPLYLWHWPLLSFAASTQLVPDDLTTLARWAIVGTSLGLALLTYRFIESPVRYGRWRPWGVWISVGAISLVCAAGAAIRAGDGYPERFPTMQNILEYESYDYTVDARSETCWLRRRADFSRFSPTCFLGPEGTHDRALFVWGDSHAARLYTGLRPVTDSGRAIAQFTRDSCPPVLDVGNDVCRDSNERILREIETSRPHTVILFAAWSHHHDTWHPDADVADALRRTLRDIRAAGVDDILVIGPFPIWQTALPRLLHRHWQQHPTQGVPARLQGGTDPAIRSVDQQLAALCTRERVAYASLVEMLCDKSGCATHIPGRREQLITWDYGHLTTEGAVYVSEMLLAAGYLHR